MRTVLLFVATATLILGQAFLGSISGIVTDASGAVIAGAKVTVTDVDRNTVYTAASNETGLYVVPQMSIGRYRIVVERTGFRTHTLNDFPLSAGQRAAIDVSLAVGAEAVEVTVTAAPQLVEGTTTTLSGTLSTKSIQDLPLNNRNIFALTSLIPGVFQTKTLSGVDDTFYGNHFIINGTQEATSDMILDGVSISVNHNVPNIPSISAIPSVEAIEEMKVLTNSFSAEYGRTGGGVVIMLTKSGTNTVHGSAFEFLRNSVMDANNFFSNRNNVPLASFKRNQYGGSVGGPIVLPKLYNGRSKTFWFATYEGMKRRVAKDATYSLPTELQRIGDFSQTFNAAGARMIIYDPFSTVPDPSRPGTYTRTPFSGNIVPTARLNPVALNMQKYYPLPNRAGLPFTRLQNWVVQGAYPEFSDRMQAKIDHNFSAATRIMGRYDIHDSVYSKPNFFGNIADPGSSPPMYQTLQSGVINLTHTIGGTKVLELRTGVGRVAANRVPWSASLKGTGGFDPTQLGLPAAIAAQADRLMFPTVSIQDIQTLGPNGGDDYHMYDMAYTSNGSLSWVVGRHTLKLGGEFRKNFVNYGRADNPVGNYQFFRSMTEGPNPISPSTTSGVGYASFLLGTTGRAAGTSGGFVTHAATPANANKYFGLYIQDDFRMSSKLTINFGLRWDVETGDTERYNRMTANDPFVKNPLSDILKWDLRGGTLFADSTLGRRSIIETPMRNFAPRLGIAYQVTPKLVIRTAYGLFYTASPYGASRHNLGDGYATTTPLLATLDGANVLNTLSNPFPDGFNRYTGSSLGLSSQLGATLNNVWPGAAKMPYNQQWNFTIQQQITSGMVAEVAYAGNKSTHLPYFQPQAVEWNQMHPSHLSKGNALLALVDNPFFGIITTPGSILAQRTVQLGQLLRPYPHYTGFQTKSAAYGDSNYHALQTRLQKRFSAGASLMVSYTFSKTISTAVDGLWMQSGNIRNHYDRSLERSVSSYDQPHRLVFSGNFELPFGRGHTLAGNASKLMNAIIGGWQTNAIVTLAKGLPLYGFGTSQNTGFNFGGGQRPDYNGQPLSIGGAQSIDKWFNTAAIVQPAAFTFGNVGRTVTAVRRDSAKNIDFSLFKSFKPVERLRVEFRAEAYNLMNTPLFAGPNLTVGSNLFGVVSAQENDPRQVQLGLKLLF